MPTIQESENIPSSSEPSSTVSLKELILSALDDKKAEEITEINLHGKSSIADSMIIASGRSNRQVASLADHVVQTVKENGFGSCKVEGLDKADWVLIDAGDIIVHLFRPEVRAFYNLEKMWMPDFTPDNVGRADLSSGASDFQN
ncbi:ribosome silencing factor [Emcibacter sp.]|uniref:ribosome silencing factor n=1 Tax=Emcibacter sp. TaxID=1979954 RepID=UPI003A9218A3